MKSLFNLVLLGLFFFFLAPQDIQAVPNKWKHSHNEKTTESYLVGVGIHDVTGPVAGTNMMGYAMPDQISQGLHTRLFARTFIFERNGKRLVVCSCDLAMIQQNIKRRVLQLLVELVDPNLYSHENVLLTSTHTHSSPAGFHDYLLYSITSLGYIHESADMIVDGIFQSILRAHKNMKQRKLKLTSDLLVQANRNRSPSSYLANPDWERQLYVDEGDTEKLMTLLAIYDSDTLILSGAINWFSVHGTSMNNTNRLISGDNKAYASYLLEHSFNSPASGLYESPYLSADYHQRAQSGSLFVGAFAQTNEGDSSPNIDGAFCINSGEPCDFESSTCKDDQGRDRNELCHAHGPGHQYGGDRESARIIGLRQFAKAQSLLTQLASDDSKFIDGSVLFEHAWIDMSRSQVKLADGSLVNTCLPARGYSFAAGTTDGPGAFDFYQGDNSTGNPLWNTVRRLISTPTPDQQQCHSPKPILLNTGQAKFPYPWEPTIVDIQLFKVGTLYILAVPGEFTTMAGRRLKREVQTVLTTAGVWTPDSRLVIAGLSNSYSGYVTTFEEYQRQRYEAASTIYGPYTLDAYIQEFKRLAASLCKQMGVEVQLELPPPVHDPRQHPIDFSDKLITVLPPVITDAVPPGKQYGELVSDVQQCYQPGDVATVEFYGGHPRNMVNYQAQVDNAQLENYFMIVEKLQTPSLHLIETDAYKFVKAAIASSKEMWWWSRLVYNQDESTLEQKLQDNIRAWLNRYSKTVDVYCKISQQNPRFLLIKLSQDGPNDPLEMEYDIAHLYPQDQWVMVRDDGDWDTEFGWQKPVAAVGPVSIATAKWIITDRPDQPIEPYKLTGTGNDMSGLYRLRYRGANRNLFGKISLHEGLSSIFKVVNDRSQCESFDFHFQINI